MKSLPTIAMTVGDPNGIGPEVIRKALSKKEIQEICHPFVIGPLSLFEQLAGKGQLLSPELNEEIKLHPGGVSKSGGRIAGKYWVSSMTSRPSHWISGIGILKGSSACGVSETSA